MLQRWIVYLTALAGSIVFYWAHGAWLSGILLMAVLVLPWLSLLLSLPAMLKSRVQLSAPAHVPLGVPGLLRAELGCPLPPPAIGGKVKFQRLWDGKIISVAPNGNLPADHCGGYRLRSRYLWMCDYLGLWLFPVRLRSSLLYLVRPIPNMPSQLPDLNRFLSSGARPKSGGGYSENHELRLYRPGDSLRQIHWKLSAKTGQLILREPMETRQDAAILTLELSGTPEQRDQKLGRLLGMSRYLAENGVKHRIFCYTGSGMVTLSVSNETDVLTAVDTLLQQRVAPMGETPGYPKALWRYHIGGDEHGQ